MTKTNDRSAALDRYRDALGPRLAGHVSAKLGVEAEFIRWDLDRKTGADVPVFRVPASHANEAIRLGLRVVLTPPPYAIRKSLRETTLAVGRTT